MPGANQQRLQSPIPDLIKCLHGFHKSQGKVSFPQSLLQASATFVKIQPQPRIPAPEITALVEALEDGTHNLCCRQDLGEAIIHGNDEILKLIAGTIIREMMDDGSSATEFFPSGFPNTSISFPDMAEHASQWTADFIGFVDGLETQGLLSQQRGPSTFAYAVFVDGTTYNTELGLSLLVTVTDELTIVVPSTKADTAKYIDIPLQNITTIHIEAAGPGSQSTAVGTTEAAVIVLHLSKASGAAYYINELSRPPCRINLAFDTINDATLIKDQIAAMAAPQDTAVQKSQKSRIDSTNREGLRTTDIPSQSAILKISSQPTSVRNTSSTVKPLGREARQSMDWTATASQVHELLAGSTRLHPSNEEVSDGSNRASAKDAADLAARSEVMTATTGVNVSEEVVRDPRSAQEKNLSGKPMEVRLRSPSSWRDGLDIIENAAEFQSNPKANQSGLDEDPAEAKRTSEFMSDDDGDLYGATPRALKRQPVTQLPSKSQQLHENSERQGATDREGSKGDSRELSRSMQVDEDEQASAFPPTENSGFVRKGKDSSTKPSSSAATYAKKAKRKIMQKPATVSNKKPKHATVDEDQSRLNSDAINTAEASIERDVFDVPLSPLGEGKTLIESQKRGGSKAKASKGNGANTKASRAKVATKPKGLSKANEPGNKAAEPEKHKNVVAPAPGEIVAANVGGHDAALQPVKKRAKRLPVQANKADKVVNINQSVKVTKGIQTGASNLSRPTRPLRSKRAAAHKANQLIQESADAADQDELAVDAQPGLSVKEIVEVMAADRLNKKTIVNSHSPGMTVPASTQKHVSPTGKAVGHHTAIRPQSTSPGKPTDVEEDLITSARLESQQSVSNPPEGPIEPAKLDRDVLLEGLDTAPYQQVEIVEQNLTPHVVDNEEGNEDEKGPVDETTTMPTKDNHVSHDKDDYEMNSGSHEDAKTAPDQGNKGMHEKCHHVIGADGMVDIRHRPEENLPVPPGSEGEPFSGIIPEDRDDPRIELQTIREVVPVTKRGKIAANAQSFKDRHVRIVQEQPLDRDIGIAGPTTSASNQEDLKQSSGSLKRQHFSSQNRTLASSTTAMTGAQLASKLSSLLDMPEVILKPSSAATKAEQPAIRGNPKPAFLEIAKNGHEAPLRQSGSISKHKLERSSVELPKKDEPVSRILGQGDHESLAQPKPTLDTNNGHGTAKSDPYTVTSGSSSEVASTDDQDNAVLTINPEVLGKANMGQKEMSNSDENQVLIAHPCLATQYRRLPETSAGKKRSREAKNQASSKKAKLRFQADMSSAINPSLTDTRVAKDLSRRPQLISFGPEGPRNQGISSPERNAVPELRSQADRGRQLARGPAQKRKRDHGVHVRHGVYGDHPGSLPNRGPKKARVEVPNHPTAAPDYIFPLMGKETPLAKRRPSAEKRLPLLIQQPRGLAKGPLAALSSLFEEDLAANVSSQGSRVDENGSPLPSQRTRSFMYPSVEQKCTRDVDSDSENVVPPLNDDEATCIDAEMDRIAEPELPAFTASHGARKKEATFTGSSNSKHGPSSPTAPSAMLTDIQAHAVQPGGRLVNVHTDVVLVPATPHDPFISPKAWPLNGFLDRLRRNGEGMQKGEGTAPVAEMADKPSNRRTLEGADPDATLVEVGDVRRPARTRRRAMPVSSSTSSPVASPQQSRLSQGSDEEKAARDRWRDALEPHQKDALSILYEISHQLVGHLIDTETAANDVVDDYQRRGTRFVENLASDLDKGLGEYVDKVKERRSESMGRYQELNARVTKNLKRKSVAEELGRQMQEKKRVLDAKMEEAMRFCDQGRL
ncbi:MAG: hypothetical protein Q9224_000816 [Gallowayella concinna]